MKEAGIDIHFAQDNQSMSKKGLLRTCTFRSSIRSAEGYMLENGTSLSLSDKNQKWLGLKDTFKF